MSTKPISEKRPWISNSVGVPRQHVKQANEIAQKKGFRHRYDEHGHAVATSPGGRNDAIKMQNGVDKDGGYGDWTGV